MMIEVCGTGCPKCHATLGNIRKAVVELGLKEGEDVAVMQVKDLKMIAARGVFLTPGVVIDGVKVSEGRIPSPAEARKWMNRENNPKGGEGK